MASIRTPLAVVLFLLCRSFHIVNAFCGFRSVGFARPGALFRKTQTSIVNLSQESGDQRNDEMMAARMMEIEELGGDPFFMSEDDDDPKSSDDEDVDDLLVSSEIMAKIAMAGGGPTSILNVVEERYATDGLGPSPIEREPEVKDPGWEWDGTVDENAHMEDF
jgi:hypothetical protein